jgi:hypothetical protein
MNPRRGQFFMAQRGQFRMAFDRIQRVYDRHDRFPEMKKGLELYEKHLASLLCALSAPTLKLR